MEIRDLHSLDDFREVVRLEQDIWGYTDPGDIITVPVFIITLKRGGILIGAFDDIARGPDRHRRGRMVGFAFSIVGIKDGRPTQWSHMMGVVADYRRTGLGRALKLAQRERAMAAGFELMEWTFDPLQALNAHLNFARLGVVCNEYVRNLYGESTSDLHRGTPTDRFVVEWRLREPHVERRIAREAGAFTIRDSHASDAPVVNRSSEAAVTASILWRRSTPGKLGIDSRRVWVEVPMGFTEMQQEAPELAIEWRQHTREIFESYFGRGYRAVDFELQQARGRGRYLLALG